MTRLEDGKSKNFGRRGAPKLGRLGGGGRTLMDPLKEENTSSSKGLQEEKGSRLGRGNESLLPSGGTTRRSNVGEGGKGKIRSWLSSSFALHGKRGKDKHEDQESQSRYVGQAPSV